MSPALISMVVFLTVFAVVVGAALWHSWVNADRRKAISRLQDVPQLVEIKASRFDWGMFLSVLGEVGWKAFEQPKLRQRLRQAGFHESHWPRAFLGAKCALFVLLPILVAVVAYSSSMLSGNTVLTLSGAAALVGLLAPEAWLAAACRRRRRQLREALPDALDMLVLCLEGGISLTGAVTRVTSELRSAHPILASEMEVLQREIQMGMTAGEAVQKFGERCDLDEMKVLASVLIQSERYGASVAKPLRIHADTSRQTRLQAAEEAAQKAAVKILFPTLLCIFPAIFIVILGPAAYQIANLFSQR
jgi:tight adherence protein C